MSDFLLDLSRNPTARNVIKTLGLPVPLPQSLERARGPWEERPLDDRNVAVYLPEASPLAAGLAVALTQAGANPLIVGAIPPAFKAPGEAYGRPATHLDLAALPAGLKLHGLLFDATAVDGPAGLRTLYDVFHALVGSLRPSAKVVLLGRLPRTQKDAAAAAAQAALEGFVRSLAKEVGKRGATAQLLRLAPEGDGRLAGPLRFLLSPRSAFVTGQRLTLRGNVAWSGEPPWTRPLDRRIALVTGAARGIGEATAERLAAEGAHVVCLDRPADDGLVSKLARAINGSVLLCDVTDPAAPATVAAALRQHGGVDVVVHNAGVTRDKTIAKMKPEAWDQAIDINLGAVTRITQALLDQELLHDGGRVICLSSVAGIAGNLGQTNYASAKAGIIGFVEYLAPRLAERGITVNAIAPGFIETRLTAAIPMMIREVGRRLAALGQGGLPGDVAEAITFLASPGAAGLSGHTLRVCGGAFIGK